jgi:hypothetical protein
MARYIAVLLLAVSLRPAAGKPDKLMLIKLQEGTGV